MIGKYLYLVVDWNRKMVLGAVRESESHVTLYVLHQRPVDDLHPGQVVQVRYPKEMVNARLESGEWTLVDGPK